MRLCMKGSHHATAGDVRNVGRRALCNQGTRAGWQERVHDEGLIHVTEPGEGGAAKAVVVQCTEQKGAHTPGVQRV